MDKRVDIWAFGVVFYELLTGKRLFQGEDVSHTMAAVIMQEPNLDVVPSQVQKLLKSCLEKDPKKRLRDIGDVWALLEEPPPPSQAGLAEPPQKKGLLWLWPSVAALLVIALAAVLWIHFREVPPPEHTLRYTVDPPEGGFVHSFAVSPNGTLVVMAASVNGKRQLWLRALDALQWQAMPSTADARYPFWSPDSRNIAFFAEGKLRRVAAGGGPSQPICDASDGRGGTWNRDDVILFAPSSGDNVIRRVAAGGGVPSDVTKNRVISHFPAFLPDGRHFLYSVSASTSEKNGIYASSLDSAQDRRLLADNSGFAFAPPSPGSRIGYLLFLRESNLMAQPLDAATAQLAGDVFPVAEGVSLTQNTSAPVSVSNNGILLYWTGGVGGGGGNNQMVWYDRSGKMPEPVGTPGNVVMPAISPDAKMIAFSKAAVGNSNDIIVRDLDRGTDRRLTTDASQNFVPFWSPNGDRIVYRSNRDGHLADLYLRASNGAGKDEPLVSTPNQKVVNQWSRDGLFIVYTEQDPKTKADLWYLPMGDGAASGKAGDRKPVQFLHSAFNELQGQLSPDSRWMAYTSDVSGQREVYVQPFPSADNEIRISTAGGEQARWSGNGKELFYLAADGKINSIAITVSGGPKPSLKAGAPVPLFDAHSASGNNSVFFNYDVMADGKRFLVSTNGATVTSGGTSTLPLTVRVNWNAREKK